MEQGLIWKGAGGYEDTSMARVEIWRDLGKVQGCFMVFAS